MEKIAAYDPGGKLRPLKKVRRRESYLTILTFIIMVLIGGYALLSSDEEVVTHTAELIPYDAIYCLDIESLKKVLNRDTSYEERANLFWEGLCNRDGGIHVLPTGDFESFDVSYSISGNIAGTTVILAEAKIEGFVPLEKGAAETIYYVSRNLSNLAYARAE